MADVSNVVKSIQDIMRKDAGTYGDAQRLEQLGWMFFLKIFDDREKELELLRDDYKSPLPSHLRWSKWAADAEGITGEGLRDFVDSTLLPKLKTLRGGEDRIAGLIRMAFADANNFMKNGTLMRQVINKINGIDFNASDDRHMFGDIYEKLLRDLQSAGNAGEFYTPRAVTQFIVDQVDPRLGESVLDPACGTGGFLAARENRGNACKAEARAGAGTVGNVRKRHVTREEFFAKFELFAELPDAVTKMRELIWRTAFSGRFAGSSAPEAWRERTIGDLASSITPGFACSRSNQVPDGHVHLRTHNISVRGSLNFDLMVRLDPAMVDSSKSSIRAGDILFNNTNSQELVGKTAFVERDYEFGFSNHLTRIRLKPEADGRFVALFLTLLRHTGYFAAICTRWINQAAVNTDALKRLSIPLPLLPGRSESWRRWMS